MPHHFSNLISQPWGVLWRTALVRAPRLTPNQILYYTDPLGPYPVIIDIPSRGGASAFKIPCYLFVKRDISADQAEKLPVVLDFHGGGFFLGSCQEQAPFCSKLARELDAVVLSVDYRMGPVSKFPAAIEDAEDVLAAVLKEDSHAGKQLRDAIRQKVLQNVEDVKKEHAEIEKKEDGKDKEKKLRKLVKLPPNPPSDPAHINLDMSRIAIAGFSSGGNLALNLALSLSHANGLAWPSVFSPTWPHPIPLLLFYPSFDARQLPSERPKGAHSTNPSPFWTGVDDLLMPTYLPRDQASHHRASPGLAEIAAIHVGARMLLVLPGVDSLAAQSEDWVRKVQEQGSRKQHLRVERYAKMKHGWTQFPEMWLDKEQKLARSDILDKAVAFTKGIWKGDESVLVTQAPSAAAAS